MAEKKKDTNEVIMTQISVEELQILKAENEAMRLTIRRQETEIKQKSEDLAETKDMLGEMVKRLSETRDLLHSALELQARYKNIADGCLEMQKENLFKWLTKRNQTALKKTLQFYSAEGQMKLILGVLDYVLFGKEYKAHSEVEKTHFKTICEKIDDDAITLPVHSLMVKLVVKYGLFDKIKEKITD